MTDKKKTDKKPSGKVDSAKAMKALAECHAPAIKKTKEALKRFGVDPALLKMNPGGSSKIVGQKSSMLES